MRTQTKKTHHLAGALFVLLGLVSCTGGADDDMAQWPEGTVIAIDSTPITAAEVDHYVEAIGRIGPAFSMAHRRRNVLMSIILPRAYGRTQGAEEREAARALAESWNAERKGGLLQGPPERPLQGTWEDIGLEVWVVASELEPGAWSEVFEVAGRYAVVQLISRDGASHASLEQFEVQLKTFPYVRNPEDLFLQYLQAKLEIVDPEWDEVIPGYWKYKMRGDS